MNKVEPIRDAIMVERIRKRCEARHKKYAVMFDFGCLCGLRISDILCLRVKDIKYPSFTVTEKKTGNKRKITMPKSMCKYLKAYIKQFGLKKDDCLIFNPWNKKVPITRQRAGSVIRGVSCDLGLSGVSTHSMRKTFAYARFSASGSVLELQSDFGHKYPSTTMLHYLSDFFPVR